MNQDSKAPKTRKKSYLDETEKPVTEKVEEGDSEGVS
jgi:hypothetical protein